VAGAHGKTVVVGGGCAGASLARLLRTDGVTIVNPTNFMLFTPMLPEAASGTLDLRHLVVPLRLMCPRAELVVGRAAALDEERRVLTVETTVGPRELSYDRLVLAVGAVPRIPPIPGLVDHAFGFKDLTDAFQLHNHILAEVERADAADDPAERERHLSFVFVGAGYAGVEGLAELWDLVEDTLRHYPRLRAVRRRWVLVDAAPRILAEIPDRLGEYADEELRQRGVEIRTGTRLESVDGDGVELSDGTRIPTRTVVWSAGVRAHPVLERLGIPLGEDGRVPVDGYLRVEGRRDVYALGDCARVPNAATPGRFDPPTSQHALRQARRLAKNLNGDPRPYRFRMLGQGASLGRVKGISHFAPLDLKLTGFLGWAATRSYHLYQLPLLSKKLRVAVDWAVAGAFERDIAVLGRTDLQNRLDED
jgi:NADH dehydrogenase